MEKTYDATTTANNLASDNYSLSSPNGGQNVSLTDFPTDGTYDTKNAGIGKTVTVTGLSLTGADASNYFIDSTASGDIGIIDPAPLTLSALSDTKTYDGGTLSSLTPTVGQNPGVDGLYAGDAISNLTQSFDSKNAGAINARTLSVDGGYVISDGNNGGNYVVTTNTAQGTINQADLTLTPVTDTKIYDSTTNSGAAPDPTLFGTDTIAVTEVFDSKNAGDRTLSIASYTINDGNEGQNYNVSVGDPVAGTITQAPLVLSAVSDTKTYDSTVLSGQSPTIGETPGVDGLYAGDTITALTQSFDSKNAGDRTLSVDGSYVISDGNGGGNYNVTTNTASGTINPAPLTLSAVSDTNTYYSTVLSGLTPTIGQTPGVDGLYAGDTITPLTQSFDSKNAGPVEARTLSVDGGYVISDGNGGGNYVVTTNTASGTINPAPLTLSAVSDTKTYDGTVLSSLTPTIGQNPGVDGLYAGDTITPLTQSFDSRNAGSRTLSVDGYTITDGNNGGNYVVTTNTAAGTINQADLTLAAVSDEKTYDGGVLSSATPDVIGLVTGDSVSSLTQSFDLKNAGPRTLSVDGGYVVNDGNDGGNYIVSTTTAAGTIDQKALTASLTGTVEKVYDTTTAANLATGNYSLVGVIAGDDVSLNDPLSGTYDTKNAGTGKTVSVSGLAVSGEDAANYTVNGSAAGDVGTIDRAPLTLSAVGDSKTYDGSVLSGATPTYSGLLEGDSISNLAESYDSRNAGSRTLLVTGYSIDDGNSGGNYAVTTTTASGAINPAALTLTAVGATKTYDGTTASGVTPGVAGLVSGDSLSNLAQSYDSKNAGARTLAVTSYTISDGNGGANYVVTTTTAAGTIDAKALTASLTGTVTKTYDGNTAASLADGNYALSGVVSGDDVSLNDPMGGTYDNPNAGTHKIVSVNGLVLSGADAANYTVNGSAAGPVGTINAPPQTQQITVPVMDVTSSEFETATASPAAAAAAASATATSATVVNVFPVAPANDQTPQGDNSPITGAGNRDLWTSSDESDKDCPKTAPCPANPGGKP